MQYLFLNQVAQGHHSLPDAKNALENLSEEEQIATLNRLALMVSQAHATPDEVAQAIVESGLRPTFTPCVLLSKGIDRGRLDQVVSLPANERQKAFHILVQVFVVADRRRRRDCPTECHHWWHQDLSDPEVLAEVRAMGVH
jgi:hypothetical protein